MVYLILAIVCSAAIALIFKYSETRGLNRYAVTAVNYIAACAVGLALILVHGLPAPEGVDLDQALAALGRLSADAPLAPAGSLAWAVAVGLVAGAFFFASFIFYQISVRRHGAGLAGAFIKLGILAPMSLSLVIWREYPALIQWAGIALAIGAIVLANWPAGSGWRGSLRPALLLLFVFGGISEFSNKAFQKYGMTEHKALFLLTTFSVAFILSAIAVWRHGRPFGKREWLIGMAVGAPNLFTSYFLIMALAELPAAVVFPVYGAGSIIVINLGGVLVFGERPGYLERWAIVMTIFALVLINL